MTAPVLSITTVIEHFLGSAPTLDEIVAFELPEALNQRALELLERRRQEQLTREEQDELEEFSRMGHFMNRVKSNARLRLAELK